MHKHLVSSLNLSVGLSMVRWNPNLPYAPEVTQLFENLTLKIGTSIRQEHGQHSEDWNVSLPQKFGNSLYSLIKGHVHHDVFCEVVKKTKTFPMFGGWSNSIVISMLVKSMCNNSKGVVKIMGCMGALTWVPPCLMHCLQLFITFCICAAMSSHQNWSHSRYSICYWPWCPASLWHPFMAATWWALGTTNCVASSSPPAGVWWWYRAPW